MNRPLGLRLPHRNKLRPHILRGPHAKRRFPGAGVVERPASGVVEFSWPPPASIFVAVQPEARLSKQRLAARRTSRCARQAEHPASWPHKTQSAPATNFRPQLDAHPPAKLWMGSSNAKARHHDEWVGGRGRQQGSSRAAPSWRPFFGNPLDDPPHAEKMEDPGPSPPREPPRAAGAPILVFPTESCATLTNVRPNPTNELFSKSNTGSLVGVGRKCQNNTIRCREESENRRPGGPQRLPSGIWSRIRRIFCTGWVVKRVFKKGVVKTGPLLRHILTTPLDEPS